MPLLCYTYCGCFCLFYSSIKLGIKFLFRTTHYLSCHLNGTLGRREGINSVPVVGHRGGGHSVKMLINLVGFVEMKKWVL